ncbi:unnamed protein product [Clonostachys rosea f. rosea IK726]|uniref:Uncharacterized protein n=1 Tax=Clonostachys rosea f. rosea IK726 TaxID=1349383 RepID=A0ACA9U6E9_BIOOC|nr:unnamed protein product [Clonostachys rosea f. rosea IK726]
MFDTASIGQFLPPVRAMNTDQVCHPTASIDHTPKPHPASPDGKLPASFVSTLPPATPPSAPTATMPAARSLQKSIRYSETNGVGGTSGSALGSVAAPAGMYFDTSELPARFRRAPIELEEIEAVESGGAALFG